MNILKLAGDAGMLVVLDGRIGCTEYRSVHGTLDAFQRFVRALETALANGNVSAEALCQSDGARSLRYFEDMPQQRYSAHVDGD